MASLYSMCILVKKCLLILDIWLIIFQEKEERKEERGFFYLAKKAREI